MLARFRGGLTFGNVVLTLALVFAMTGGAYAAKRYVITSTRQISPKVLKALAGKAGPVGPAGVQGPVGSAGKDGTNGASGVNGKNGVNGENVTLKEVPTKVAACGEQGGAELEVGGATSFACNGRTGFTEALPPGKTLKGDWAIEANVPGTGAQLGSASTAISFGIPLAAAPTPVYVKAGETTPPPGCTGSIENPGAEPGHLCVFAASEENTETNEVPHICSSDEPVFICLIETGAPYTADPSGAVIGAIDENAGVIMLNGTWAVTAE